LLALELAPPPTILLAKLVKPITFHTERKSLKEVAINAVSAYSEDTMRKQLRQCQLTEETKGGSKYGCVS
jgi:hypothetical protein